MPANATTALEAVEDALTGLYPTIPVYVTKRPVAGNRPPIGGWNPGWQLPCFVLCALEPESVDDDGSFEEVSVKYTLSVELCKASHAKTAGGTDPMLMEDSEIRDKRQAVRNLLYKPRLTGITDVANVAWKARPVYEVSGAGGAPVLVSGQQATFEVFETRPE